jgi:hypothetical protein
MWFKIGIKNFGRTPANVTDVLIKALLLPSSQALPEIPDYARERKDSPKAFLVSGDEFFYTDVVKISAAEVPQLRNETITLWLYGYVDYIDQFGQRHRGGYARVYSPAFDNRGTYKTDEEFKARSNLLFVSQDGYNYDRTRKKGEGNDWDEMKNG